MNFKSVRNGRDSDGRDSDDSVREMTARLDRCRDSLSLLAV